MPFLYKNLIQRISGPVDPKQSCGHFGKLKRTITLGSTLLFLGVYGSAHAQSLTVMPVPAKVIPGMGQLHADCGFRFVFEGLEDSRLDRARDRFLMQLSRQTGILRWPETSSTTPRLVIQTKTAGEDVQAFDEDESYHLRVTPTEVLLSAPTTLGILHGLQTLLQLIHTSPDGFVVDAVTIDDKPRFVWRGLMIDVARHFQPVEVIRQNLDLMEAAKLNVLHWHLSDDQGFRVESRTYPLLQGKGSDGMYYTQAQIREIIEYAHERGIHVVPEFDMPCHTSAWLAAYPELASGKGSYQIERKWGVFDPAMDPTRESTYAFLDSFLAETTSLFPDAYFHIGGDECTGKEWDANPRIQQFIQSHALKNKAGLQAYFTDRVQKLVIKHGKIPVGWDEVLQPGTPKQVVIQSWSGQDLLAKAARSGNHTLMSWGYYLDLNEPASQHYAVDPLDGSATQLTQEEQARILGGEAAEWSEYITPENITGRIWPRAAAIAERLWSPQTTRDQASMYLRLEVFEQRLAWYSVEPNFVDRPTFRRLVSKDDVESFKLLADAVEPPKEYAREELRKYNAYTPLNRMVDAIPSESIQARQLHTFTERIVSGTANAADFDEAREMLTRWKENHRLLEPHLHESALTEELIPVSQDLSRAAAIGLIALEKIQNGTAVDVSTQQTELTELKQMEAPKAVLLDQIVPSVEMLVRATKH
jgi:hexosaminidase